MTGSPLSAQLSAASSEELLSTLKDLKNEVIGNTRRKVQIANDEAALLLYVLCNLKARSSDVADFFVSSARINHKPCRRLQ